VHSFIADSTYLFHLPTHIYLYIFLLFFFSFLNFFAMFSQFSLSLPSLRFLSSKPEAGIDIPAVAIHKIETAHEKPARTLKHLLKLNHVTYSILYNDGRFHNHVPHVRKVHASLPPLAFWGLCILLFITCTHGWDPGTSSLMEILAFIHCIPSWRRF